MHETRRTPVTAAGATMALVMAAVALSSGSIEAVAAFIIIGRKR
jgi:hypothetical protein